LCAAALDSLSFLFLIFSQSEYPLSCCRQPQAKGAQPFSVQFENTTGAIQLKQKTRNRKKVLVLIFIQPLLLVIFVFLLLQFICK
jgi:hypothetical protein